MAFVTFMFGLAMVLFGTAWGLVKIGAATPLVMTVSLLIAGVAIIRVWRFGAGKDQTEAQSKWMHDRQQYGRRRLHFAQNASSQKATLNLR